MIEFKSIKNIDLKDKRILLRCDFNVPLKDGRVVDDYRIQAAIPTIESLLEQQCSIVIISHAGRPKGEVKPDLSLRPVAHHLQKLLGHEVRFIEATRGEKVKNAVKQLRYGEIIMLENLRFHIEETVNDDRFAKELASYCEVFVDDAFAVVHREHASTVGVAHYRPAVAGLLVENEVKTISQATKHPKKPLAVIVGGAKIETKMALLENLLIKADTLIIGGAMANTFFVARGIKVGKSLYDKDEVAQARRVEELCKQHKVKLIIPDIDVAVGDSVDEKAERRDVKIDEVGDEDIILDMGKKSTKEILEELKKAKTVIWNGPLGMSELPNFLHGSEKVAKAIAKSDQVSIVGGGDTAALIRKLDLMDKFTLVSTGGGASLKLMSGKVLPGVQALAKI